MHRLVCLGVALAIVLGMPCTSAAQEAPTESSAPPTVRAASTARGVVWTPPSRARPAATLLRAMHESGITAVRLTRLVPEEVLPVADTLGLRLFVDVPAAYRSASALRDALPALQDDIERIGALAQRHPSLHAVGLAQNAATHQDATCDLLGTLAATVRRSAPARLRSYYVTLFPPTHDRGTDRVDTVLVDLRGVDRPASRW